MPELERQVPLQSFHWLPISNARVLAVGDLESDDVHRKPFVPLLVCQLQRYGATEIVI